MITHTSSREIKSQDLTGNVGKLARFLEQKGLSATIHEEVIFNTAFKSTHITCNIFDEVFLNCKVSNEDDSSILYSYFYTKGNEENYRRREFRDLDDVFIAYLKMKDSFDRWTNTANRYMYKD